MSPLLKYVWAFPTTFIGLLLVPLTLISGGSFNIVDGVIELHGGAATWLLTHAVPLSGGAAAMTLGHVVLGRDLQTLRRTRDHERVHVQQAERWGPLFIPAYLLGSAWASLRGGDAYRDNPFEREAFAIGTPADPHTKP